MRVCSIASYYALAHVRVLAEAVTRLHPDASLDVLALEPRAEEPLAEVPGVHVVRLADFGPDVGMTTIATHGWADAAAVLRPCLLAGLLARYGEPVVHLDPDVMPLRTLDTFAGLGGAGGVVLTPRVVEELPGDGLEPGYDDLLAVGQLDPGLLAVCPGDLATRFLEWWARVLFEELGMLTASEQASSLEHPQPALARVLELAPTLFPDAVVERDPGWNLSWWNLHARPLERVGDELLVGGRTAGSIHFEGFRPDRPFWLSDRGTRVRVLDEPVLSELCGSYARRLLESGWTDPAHELGAGGRLGNGLPFDARMRRLYASSLAAGRDFGGIHTRQGGEAFADWLREPVGGSPITRYLYEVYLERDDLQVAYPDPTGLDADGLAGWAWVHGRPEMELVEELLPPLPEEHGGERQLAVNVVGYFEDSLGIGEAARLYVDALESGGVAVSTTSVRPDLPVEGNPDTVVRSGQRSYSHLASEIDPQFNLVCVNGDHLQRFAPILGPDTFAGRTTIGVWGWETDVLPPSWMDSFGLVDELWVYSRFVAENLGRLSPVPVIPMPLPVTEPQVGSLPGELKLPDGFKFLFMFDFFSTLGRKNPLGVVQAFTRAFSPGEGPQLVLKTINAEHRPEAYDELRWAGADRPDVHILDLYLDEPQKAALIDACDCYVSLHRSEGWGLTLIESMALGKPVMGTGYSGNLDFMTPLNSYLVDWKPASVGPNEVYPADGVWAEPDLDHAASLMRSVWENPEEATARGARGREEVLARFSPAAVGRLLRSRLERLAGERPVQARATGSAPALEELRRRMAVDHSRNASGPAGGAKGLARRLLLRLMRPFTFHQRELDLAIVAALEQTDEALARERAALRRERVRLNRLESELETRTEASGADARFKPSWPQNG